MVTPGLRLTAAFVALWMLPASLAVLVWLATRSTRPSTPRALRVSLRLLILAYCAAAMAINLWPFDFDLSILRVIQRGNFEPLHGSLDFLRSDRSLGSYLREHDSLHLVLLAPVGVLLPLQLKRSLRVLTLAASALAVVMLTCGLEVAQGLAVAGRGFDVDDALAGTAGALAAVIGGAILKLVVDGLGRGAEVRREEARVAAHRRRATIR